MSELKHTTCPEYPESCPACLAWITHEPRLTMPTVRDPENGQLFPLPTALLDSPITWNPNDDTGPITDEQKAGLQAYLDRKKDTPDAPEDEA